MKLIAMWGNSSEKCNDGPWAFFHTDERRAVVMQFSSVLMIEVAAKSTKTFSRVSDSGL